MSYQTRYSRPYRAMHDGVYALTEHECGNTVHIVRLALDTVENELFYTGIDDLKAFSVVGIHGIRWATPDDLTVHKPPASIDSHGLISYYKTDDKGDL